MRTNALDPRMTVSLPGGQFSTIVGQYVAGKPPSQNFEPRACIGRKWILEPVRSAMTRKAFAASATASGADADAGAAAAKAVRVEVTRVKSFMMFD